MSRYRTIDDVDVAGRRVLVRADLNVPLDTDGEKVTVTDDFRLRAALPTIQLLRERDAVVVLASHLGRPKGHDDALRMAPVADRLAELGGFAVTALQETGGRQVLGALRDAEPGDVLLLENTRFEAGETSNDPQLAARIAELADLFVLDAFGSAHRAHASTVGVTDHLPSVAGPLLVAEVQALSQLLDDPPRPFVVVLGGAKVSDKLGVIHSLLPRVDRMLIGGGMCFSLMAARGMAVGDSMVELEHLDELREVLASKDAEKILLPVDIVTAPEFAEDAPVTTVDADAIADGQMGLDIGPRSRERFAEEIGRARSVFWNGPMGVFEWEAFREGTAVVARAVASADALTVVGGGDSVAAVRQLGLESAISHVSTGGGAGLEFIEGKTLPGLAALEKWAQ